MRLKRLAPVKEMKIFLAMLLIDEADTIGAARGVGQRHHEDDSGVNTIIQEIDKIRGNNLPVFL